MFKDQLTSRMMRGPFRKVVDLVFDNDEQFTLVYPRAHSFERQHSGFDGVDGAHYLYKDIQRKKSLQKVDFGLLTVRKKSGRCARVRGASSD
jgi:hypothetical protein